MFITVVPQKKTIIHALEEPAILLLQAEKSLFNVDLKLAFW
jgi:hypothetical protein